jgi:hypothetical protein
MGQGRFIASAFLQGSYARLYLINLVPGQAVWQPVGLKGNRLQKRLAGSYFAAFSANRITIGPQNLPSPSHFFAAILQVRQTAGAAPSSLALINNASAIIKNSDVSKCCRAKLGQGLPYNGARIS